MLILIVVVSGAENPSKTIPLSARDGSLESTQNKRVAIIVNHRSDLRRATTSYGGERQSPKTRDWKQAGVRPTARVRIFAVQDHCPAQCRDEKHNVSILSLLMLQKDIWIFYNVVLPRDRPIKTIS